MSRQTEREELFKMASGQTLMDACDLCKHWGFEPEGDSLAMVIRAMNCGRLLGEASCDLPHLQEINGKLVEMALVVRERPE